MNHIILDALNAQLQLKKSEVTTYKQTVKKQHTDEINASVLEYMKAYVDKSIKAVDVSNTQIYIYPAEEKSYSDGITIYKRANWFSSKEDRTSPDRKYTCELSWYSSTASSADIKKLCYLAVLGNVADCFLDIESEYLTTWSKSLKVVDEQCSQMYSEIYKLEHSIREVSDKVKAELLDKYKQVGFEMKSFAKSTHCTWNDDNTRSIKESDMSHQLHYGRGKWDRVNVKSFKVAKVNKGKYSLIVTQTHGEKETVIELSSTRMDQFIETVCNWETIGSKSDIEHANKVYETYLNGLKNK